MGAKKQTIGYRYFMSLLSGLCRGPINELVAIKAGDEIAFEGSVTNDATQTINKPNLFGGEKKEGGIQGPFKVFMGGPNQVLPGASGSLPSVKGSIGGGLISEFRGVVTVWYDGLVSAMNPYIKEWKFRVRRTTAGWWGGVTWYPEKCMVLMADGAVIAMNGAHIIYECCTNPLWGRGLAANKINENSFVYAANKLCSEAFGLCIVWYRKEDIDVFIQKICDLIGATLYTDRETGLVTLRLVRDDYDPDDLPLFTPETGLLDITDDDTGSADTTFNEVIGTGRDPVTNQEFQIRAQNLAAFQSQQAVSSLDQDYRGIPTKDLVGRLVLRDLRANAAGLKRFTVTLDRRGWRIAPGMPFRIADPRRGLANIVVRAGEIDDGDMINGKIVIKVVQDVFGLPTTSYVAPVEGGWTPPDKTALPPLEARIVEASYRDVYVKLGAAAAEAAPVDDGYIGTLALSPNAMSYQYDLATRAEGEAEYETRTTGSFTGNAVLAVDIGPADTSFEIGDPKSFDAENIGEAILIDDEYIRLDAYDDVTNIVTVTRGVADTIPQAHETGARLWTIDDDYVTDERAYSETETAYAKVLTRTSNDALDLADSPELSVEIAARQGRPYPPGKVEVGGTSIYATLGETPEPVITWASRNRLTQGDHLVGHGEDAVTAEAGTTYTIRIFATDGTTLLREVPDIAADTWTYDAAMQTADGEPSVVFVELESVRDGITSWQFYRFRLVLKSGWGYGWGFNWGGLSA